MVQYWSWQDEVLTVTPVEVIGVARGGEKPSIFVPANDPNSSQWFYVDVPAIARACGLPENTIYIEDINENIDPSNTYPVPKDVNTLIRSSVMPQDHLNYTLTWYFQLLFDTGFTIVIYLLLEDAFFVGSFGSFACEYRRRLLLYGFPFPCWSSWMNFLSWHLFQRCNRFPNNVGYTCLF